MAKCKLIPDKEIGRCELPKWQYPYKELVERGIISKAKAKELKRLDKMGCLISISIESGITVLF